MPTMNSPTARTVGLANVLILTSFVATPALSETRQSGIEQQPIAAFEGDIAELSGIWAVDCSNPDDYFTLFNQTHVFTLSGEHGVVGYVPLAESWVNDDMVAIERTGGQLIWTIGNDVYEDQQCADLPATLSALHGEAVSFFLQTDDLIAACEESGQACLETFFEHADIANTGGLNEADLSRLIRIGGNFGVIGSDGEATFDDIAISQAVSIPLAPLAASLLIRGFDYDADGQLSIAEIAQDRNLFDTDQLGATPGAAQELEDNIRQSVQQLQQLLIMMQ